VHWLGWEFIPMLTIPFLFCIMVLIASEALKIKPKSLGNFVIEPMLVGCAVPLAAVLRVIFANQYNDVYMVWATVGLVCLFALTQCLCIRRIGI
jgi:hypothetical protein